MDSTAQYSFILLKTELNSFAVQTRIQDERIYFSFEDQTISFLLGGKTLHSVEQPVNDLLPLDYLVRAPLKIAALVVSRLGLNKRIFARHCLLKKVDKALAEKFVDSYHLMGAAQSAFNLGLFYKEELLCLASFSKGRKMRRLKEEERSFELIRFCCKAGFTVTGGLSKLVKNFAVDKKVGDIMTYVDRQLSEGRSFVRSGFKHAGETEAVYFLVNKKSFEKRILKSKDEDYDLLQFYRSKNMGNLKLIYTPGE